VKDADQKYKRKNLENKNTRGVNMRKSWKWTLCLGVVSLLLLGGCGKEKTEPVDLVLVTDGSEVASDAVYQSAWNGLAQYGDESGLKYEASVPAGRTTEDYENTIKEAAQKGASVIVCAGTSMSRAVYDAQRDWKDVRFLLLEAEPVSESGRSRLRGNTESLEIDVSEAGYLAGYAAVQAGYTHLGYIGQKNEENGTKYGTGYALGAEAAAADLGLGENSITLDYTYRKSSSVSPSYLEKIKSWYGEGGQILFSDGASYQNVLGAAASAAGGALIANGGVEEYANAVLKVRLDYGTAVYNALKEMKQKDFEGGKIVTRGVTDQEISLEWNQDAVPYFTEDQYRALCAKFSAEDFSIPDGDALSSPDQYKLSCVSVQKVK
jgi:basic membrane protein A